MFSYQYLYLMPKLPCGVVLQAQMFSGHTSLGKWHRQAAKLCNTKIASTKCTKWHRFDARWYTSTKSVRRVLDQHFGYRIISRHFSFSVVSSIPWSDSGEFLVLGIHQVQRLHMQPSNFVRDKRFYKAWDCKHPSWRIAFRYIVHRLPHAMSKGILSP